MGGDQFRDQVAGDIVVTKVAHHYHIGRVQAAGKPWATIAVMDTLADALTLACRLVTGAQRVFLYARGGVRQRVEIDCAKPFWLQ